MTRRPPPHLQTARLDLRLPELGDAPQLERYAGDPEVALMTQSVPHPYPAGGAVGWIEGERAAWQAGRDLSLVLLIAGSEGPAGCISLMDIGDGSAELGYWLGRPFWGEGYMTEAALALCDYGFERLGLTEITAGRLSRNPASGRVLEKAGFLHVGSSLIENWRGSGETASSEDYRLRVIANEHCKP